MLRVTKERIMTAKIMASSPTVSSHAVGKKLRRVPFLLLLALSMTHGSAQAGEYAAFEESVRAAMDSNHRIRAARANLNATKEQYGQSLGELLPSVTLSASQSHRFLDDQSTTDQNFTSSSRTNEDHEISSNIRLAMDQPLLNWQAILALKQTAPIISAAVAGLNKTTQDVLLETIQLIISVLLTQNIATLAESNLKFTKSNLDSTLARRKAGYLTRTDVDQAKARVSSAEAELIHANNEVMVARARFEEVVRMPVPDGLKVPDIPEPLLAGTLDAISLLSHKRSDIQAAKYNLEVADYTLRMSKSGHLPTMNLSAAAYTNHHEIGDVTQQNSEYTVGIQFSLPLYSGGKTRSKVRTAGHTKASKQIELDRIHDQAMREVKQAYLEMHSAKATLEADEVAFNSYNEALTGMQEEFKAGFRTVIDLLESQNQLFSAETDLVRDRYELISSQYQLLHTIGMLTTKNLRSYEDDSLVTISPHMISPKRRDAQQRQQEREAEVMVQEYILTEAKSAWTNLPFLNQNESRRLNLSTVIAPIQESSKESSKIGVQPGNQPGNQPVTRHPLLSIGYDSFASDDEPEEQPNQPIPVKLSTTWKLQSLSNPW